MPEARPRSRSGSRSHRRLKLAWYHAFYRNWPGRLGQRLRRTRLPSAGPPPVAVGKACTFAFSSLRLGHDVRLGEHVRIFGEVKIGAGTEIQQYVSLWAIGGDGGGDGGGGSESERDAENGNGGSRAISIGNSCILEPGVSIMAQMHEHRSRDLPIREQGARGGPVRIGDDVLLGRLAIVLPNVTIATGAVVMPGSVVTRDIGAYEIVQGVPAEVVGCRE